MTANRRRHLWMILLSSLALALVLSIAVACGGGDDDDDNDDNDNAATSDDDSAGDDDDDSENDDIKKDPTVSDEATMRPGPTEDGRYILNNGRALSPVGERVTVERYPISIAKHPTLDYIYTATARTPNLITIDSQTMHIVNSRSLPRHFGGLVVNSAGDKLWVALGSNEKILEYLLVAGIPQGSPTEISAFGYPTNLALSADETKLYVTLAFGKRVKIIDLDSGLEVGEMSTGIYPYDIALSPETNRAITANWGTWSASVFNLKTGKLIDDVPVGKNPESVVLSPDGKSAYVVCGDTDDVHEVDLKTAEVTRVIPLYDDLETDGLGAMPTGATLSADEKYLLVASAGYNCIFVVDLAAGEVVGKIPTEWYPEDLVVDGDDIYVITAKGIGAGASGKNAQLDEAFPKEGGALRGSVESIVFPNAQTLADYTEMVDENNLRPSTFYDLEEDFDSPIPKERGKPSEQIKHVVVILKENKTYDQVMGDYEGAEGDESLTVFGEPYTPNLHALSAEFSFCDNYYVEARESDMGHAWATSVMANNYIEKNWVAEGWTLLTGVEPGAIPASGTVFGKMLENDISFRVYGEVVGTISDIGRLAPYMDLNYGFYNQAVSDRLKAMEVIREWEAGIFPQFMYISIPNDHTFGSDPGKPTPQYMVADNDAGMGMLVDWIINSEYWPETAIFILEDDPQSGVDHIDVFRSPFNVVSPYAKRGHISNVQYSMAGMWMTIELILGMPPMTNYDRYTAPMYDLFQTQQILDTDYEAIPSNVPYAINGADLPFAEYSAKQDWSTPDQVERISEVIWAIMKPGVPFPYEYAAAPSWVEEEEAEEEDEAVEYKELMEAYTEFALESGRLDPDFSLLAKKDLHWTDEVAKQAERKYGYKVKGRKK
ncbi:MAG: bifunctional YncE family protein/alkaline phosphatase family protein [Deltaproteobacteria bacterium]|nr:bifunctional YncE family protein/alkaline phosphatase family protein [Deltaproteobacteria bacterium]